MTIHLTEAQAREMKLRGLQLAPAVSAKPRKKGMARAGSKSRCVACGEEFTSDAAEDRHLAETPHRRFETVLEEA